MGTSLQSAVAMFCLLALPGAETGSIGTASVHGEIRVDNRAVKGNATLFDGSEIETGGATADLRLEKGSFAKLSTNFQGKLYRDHLELQRGETEVAAPSAFQVQIQGIHVAASQPNSRALVSLRPNHTIEVAALAGAVMVTDGHGVGLANVHAGQPMTFAPQSQADPSQFSGTGKLVHANGHYYLILSSNGIRYELLGADLEALVGKDVTIEGTLDPNIPSTPDAAGVVTVRRKRRPAAGYATKAVIAGVIVAAGIGLGLGLASSNSSVPQASAQ